MNKEQRRVRFVENTIAMVELAGEELDVFTKEELARLVKACRRIVVANNVTTEPDVSGRKWPR